MRMQPQRAGARSETRGPRVASHFDEDVKDDTANFLGLHVPLGYEIVAQSVAYPFPEHYARQIREEIDSAFVPLWINRLFRTPNDGHVWTGHHMLARHVPIPRETAPRIKHLSLPLRMTYGIRYKNPLLESDILDGLTDEERDAGALPRFEQFTGLHLASMRRSMWMRNNLTADERMAKSAEAARLAVLRRQRANDASGRYRRLDRARERQVADGTRVYMSPTLRALRLVGAETELIQ